MLHSVHIVTPLWFGVLKVHSTPTFYLGQLCNTMDLLPYHLGSCNGLRYSSFLEICPLAGMIAHEVPWKTKLRKVYQTAFD